MTYNQYDSTPTGLSYLSGDIMPWHDYVIFRSDENTSVAVYGVKSDDLTWEDATVRKVWRTNNYNTYQVSEEVYDTVTVNIDNPYYAYGNVIGVNYSLPSSQIVTSNVVSAAVIIIILVSIFRTVWSLKRGVTK